ncbi:MAG: DUF2959 family protein [Lacunisphaera sp.]
MKTSQLLRLALVTAVSGAFSALFAGQDELAAAIQQARSETILTHNQLVANLKALDALVSQKEGDLRPAYTAFAASLKETRAASDRTIKRATLLHDDGEKRFATWQAEVETIKDEGIRAHALKRLDAARKNWNGAAAALQEATVQFPVLLGYLTDIEKALSYDLTPDGVKSVRGAARSAMDSFSRVQELAQKAVGELDQMTADMSSTIKS